MKTIDLWDQQRRLGGLRRFALAITVLNIVGFTILGFEQSFAQPIVCLATSYGFELLIAWIDASQSRKRPVFLESWTSLCNCLLSAHITGLAVAMLLYSGNQLLPSMFAAAVAIVSKSTVRFSVGGRSRHFMNPSNLGITATLLLFPWVGIAPPYHFTEGLSSTGSVILPFAIFLSGTVLNYRFTGRALLIFGWWGGFLLQAAFRHLFFQVSLISALGPATGVAFLLFSFYMVTDPATTPFRPRNQFAFGLAVAGFYGFLVSIHIVFGFFFALTIVSLARGTYLLALRSAWRKFSTRPALTSTDTMTTEGFTKWKQPSPSQTKN